jgi:hypothetical protein
MKKLVFQEFAVCDICSLEKLMKGSIPKGIEIDNNFIPLPYKGSIEWYDIKDADDGIYWVIASGSGLSAKYLGKYYRSNVVW